VTRNESERSSNLESPHRQTINGSTRYFIRQINHLFVVGQTYPHQHQIDPPTSNATRDRRTKRNRDLIRRLLLKNNDILKEKTMRSLFPKLHSRDVQNIYKVCLGMS
jgi:hypothetical protein